MHVRPEHVFAALDAAASGPVAEGCVGGGTGMNCHQFKGGIGTASRLLSAAAGGWTVGALVQANHGRRELLRIDGVPVGQEIGLDAVPPPGPAAPIDAGSIIIVIATDAPLLPHPVPAVGAAGGDRPGARGRRRRRRRAATSSWPSAPATAACSRPTRRRRDADVRPHAAEPAMTLLFEAAAEATEEAIVNALCRGNPHRRGRRDGLRAPNDRLQELASSS